MRYKILPGYYSWWQLTKKSKSKSPLYEGAIVTEDPSLMATLPDDLAVCEWSETEIVAFGVVPKKYLESLDMLLVIDRTGTAYVADPIHLTKIS